jgi:hypothetical protein
MYNYNMSRRGHMGWQKVTHQEAKCQEGCRGANHSSECAQDLIDLDLQVGEADPQHSHVVEASQGNWYNEDLGALVVRENKKRH